MSYWFVWLSLTPMTQLGPYGLKPRLLTVAMCAHAQTFDRCTRKVQGSYSLGVPYPIQRLFQMVIILLNVRTVTIFLRFAK